MSTNCIPAPFSRLPSWAVDQSVDRCKMPLWRPHLVSYSLFLFDCLVLAASWIRAMTVLPDPARTSHLGECCATMKRIYIRLKTCYTFEAKRRVQQNRNTACPILGSVGSKNGARWCWATATTSRHGTCPMKDAKRQAWSDERTTAGRWGACLSVCWLWVMSSGSPPPLWPTTVFFALGKAMWYAYTTSKEACTLLRYRRWERWQVLSGAHLLP